MNNKLLVGLTVGLFIFSAVGLANAITFTQEFYVQIDSIEISQWPSRDPLDYFNEQQAKAYYRVPSVGSRSYGAVTYNNATIPRTGTYIIGIAEGYEHTFDGDERQAWVMNWKGFDGLAYSDIAWDVGHYDRLLNFKDGKLSGLSLDVLPGEGFLGGSGFGGTGWSYGGPLFYSENHQALGVTAFGTLHVTPEPSTLILLGAGLVGLIGFTRKFRKS